MNCTKFVSRESGREYTIKEKLTLWINNLCPVAANRLSPLGYNNTHGINWFTTIGYPSQSQPPPRPFQVSAAVAFPIHIIIETIIAENILRNRENAHKT